VKRRVVITGIGIATCLGTDVSFFWEQLQHAKSGISRISSFDTSKYGRFFGGEVRELSPEYLSLRKTQFLGRASQLTFFAASQALKDAGMIREKPIPGARTAIVLGTTFGEVQTLENASEELAIKRVDGIGGMPVAHLRHYLPNSLSARLGRKLRWSGPNYTIGTACAAGNHAIGIGAALIRLGIVDLVVAGGSDPISKVAFSGFARLGIMADEKCQPFDKNRRGMLVSEGSGIVVLEELQSASSRGANLYAEVAGLGLSCDAHHMTLPACEGMVASMQSALRDSGICERDIDYICAHGTGTPVNDRMESLAIRKLFYDGGNCVPVSSIKSMIGHAMGAASAIEVVACALAIRDGIVPPTANHENEDPECNVDCVPNRARKKKLRFVLNNAFAFGGNNACLVLASI
jgi:3-oxoacyl-[acyl-carrier-protein] synthase II